MIHEIPISWSAMAAAGPAIPPPMIMAVIGVGICFRVLSMDFRSEWKLCGLQYFNRRIDGKEGNKDLHTESMQ